jgi:molybdate transport system substrate-binding protein
MSANMKYPEALYKEKLAITKPIVYAKGTLAILSSKKRDFSKGIKTLQDTNIRNIAIANAKTAPYGVATKEALINAHIYKKLMDKFVYAESISQTISYTVRATDIGIIAKSSLYSPKMKAFKKDINWIDIDTKLYKPTQQGIVILKAGEKNKDVENFYNFILSSKAKQILYRFGYL